MCVELAGKLSEDLRQPGSWGAAVHTLTFQSGTENFAILGSLFWDKGSNSELGKTLPYKADPEAVNTPLKTKQSGYNASLKSRSYFLISPLNFRSYGCMLMLLSFFFFFLANKTSYQNHKIIVRNS